MLGVKQQQKRQWTRHQMSTTTNHVQRFIASQTGVTTIKEAKQFETNYLFIIHSKENTGDQG